MSLLSNVESIRIGQEVMMMRSETSPQLLGLRLVVDDVSRTDGGGVRFVYATRTGPDGVPRLIRLKPSNVVPFVPAGTRVRIVDLSKTPEYNGREGAVCHWQGKDARWKIQLDKVDADASQLSDASFAGSVVDRNLVLIKPVNLQRLNMHPSVIVVDAVAFSASDDEEDQTDNEEVVVAENPQTRVRNDETQEYATEAQQVTHQQQEKQHVHVVEAVLKPSPSQEADKDGQPHKKKLTQEKKQPEAPKVSKQKRGAEKVKDQDNNSKKIKIDAKHEPSTPPKKSITSSSSSSPLSTGEKSDKRRKSSVYGKLVCRRFKVGRGFQLCVGKVIAYYRESDHVYIRYSDGDDEETAVAEIGADEWVIVDDTLANLPLKNRSDRFIDKSVRIATTSSKQVAPATLLPKQTNRMNEHDYKIWDSELNRIQNCFEAEVDIPDSDSESENEHRGEENVAPVAGTGEGSFSSARNSLDPDDNVADADVDVGAAAVGQKNAAAGDARSVTEEMH